MRVLTLVLAALTVPVLVCAHPSDPVRPGHVAVRAVPGMTAERLYDIVRPFGLTVHRAYLTPEQAQRVRRRIVGASTQRVSALREVEERLLRSFVVTFTDTTRDPRAVAAMLTNRCAQIEVAEPVFVPSLCARTPNDTLVSQQAMLATIKAFDAWEVEDGDSTVLIGISDSGVLQDHADLRDNIHVNTGEIPDNGIDDDGNGYIDDYRGYNFTSADDGTKPGDTYNPREGHGTAVAGLASARTDNIEGIAGTGFRCKIVPLKTMPIPSSGIVYGYESIIYCAVNGVQIVNCSWGGFSRSCINEDVIAYATEAGTTVVAAAGNHGTAAPFYPAQYRHVLGVGVTDPRDGYVPMSGRGPGVEVMAPGNESLATSNNGAYGGFCCTSGSSPIAAGMVGLIRSRHPQLTAREAAALAREAVDDVQFSEDDALFPGRMNMLTAVTLDPGMTPALDVWDMLVTSSEASGRYGQGDTVTITLDVINDLASVSELECSIDIVAGADALQSLSSQPSVPAGIGHGERAPITVGRYVVLTDDETQECILRCSITGRGPDGAPYQRALLARFTPSPGFLTLRNDSLTVSIGDHMRIGNTDLERGQGEGLTWRTWCGQLYECGLMISAGQKVVDVVRAGSGINDLLTPVKRFREPDALYGEAVDSAAGDDAIGLLVGQRVFLAPADSAMLDVAVTITNTSDTVLYGLDVAWFSDWDLGVNAVANRVALTSSSTGDRSAVQTYWSTADPVAASMAVWSDHADASPIAAGIDNAITYRGFSVAMKDSLLASGVTLSFDDIGDVAGVTGMHFNGPIFPGETRSVHLCMSLGSSADVASARAKACMDAQRAPQAASVQIHVYPNPATRNLKVAIDAPAAGTALVTVVAMDGRSIDVTVPVSAGRTITDIDVTGLASGTYLVAVDILGARASTSVQVLR